MSKLKSFISYIWFTGLAPSILLVYYEVCLLEKCSHTVSTFMIPKLLFVLGFIILSDGWCIIPTLRLFKYIPLKLHKVIGSILLTQVVLEYIWMQLIQCNKIILLQIYYIMHFFTETLGLSDYFNFLEEDASNNWLLNIEALLLLYYSFLSFLDPLSFYRSLKYFFEVQPPRISFTNQANAARLGCTVPVTIRGRSPCRC
uniref:Uncharacterized protein n=1 Tax=Clastoptera arizonana TaxID=38151 RepID=A0A1B6DMJ0_9HEMI